MLNTPARDNIELADFPSFLFIFFFSFLASTDKDECYGETPEHQIYIGVAKEEELANFHIRTFRLYKMHNNVCIRAILCL